MIHKTTITAKSGNQEQTIKTYIAPIIKHGTIIGICVISAAQLLYGEAGLKTDIALSILQSALTDYGMTLLRTSGLIKPTITIQEESQELAQTNQHASSSFYSSDITSWIQNYCCCRLTLA